MKAISYLTFILLFLSLLVLGNYDWIQYGKDNLPNDPGLALKVAITEAQKPSPDMEVLKLLKPKIMDATRQQMEQAMNELTQINRLQKLPPSDLQAELLKLNNINRNLFGSSDKIFTNGGTKNYITNTFQKRLTTQNGIQNNKLARVGGISKGKAVGYGALGATLIAGLGAAAYFAYDGYYRRPRVLLPPPPLRPLPPARVIIPPPLPPLPPVPRVPLAPPVEDIVVGVPTPYYVKKKEE